MDAKTTIKVLDSIVRVYSLRETALAAVEQAKQDVITLDAIRNTQFMKNARESADES